MPSPKPNPLGLGKPVGLGRPKEDGENRSPENVGDMGGRGGAAVAAAVAAAAAAVVAPVVGSALLPGTFPSAIFSASCRITALPGDSNPVKEFTHPASPGDNCGNGENDSGDTPGNGETPAPCFDSGEKLPNGKSELGCVAGLA